MKTFNSNEQVQTLAARLYEASKLDTSTGVVTFNTTPDELLPEGITMDILQKVNRAYGDITSATMVATNNHALDGFKANSDLKEVTSEYHVGKDVQISHHVSREKTYNTKLNGVESSVTKYAENRSAFKFTSADSDLRKIRKEINAEALNVLA
jgi:hypothetical protein